jgi:hypothetical protein
VRDIVTTVNFCRSNGIPTAVRGKGAQYQQRDARQANLQGTPAASGQFRK